MLQGRGFGTNLRDGRVVTGWQAIKDLNNCIRAFAEKL